MSINHCNEYIDQLKRREKPGRQMARAGRGIEAHYSPLPIPDGNVTIEVHPAGSQEIIERQRVKNRIVTVGLWAIRDLLVNIGLAPQFFAVGGNNTPTTDDMGALLDEKFRTQISRRDRIGNKAVFQSHLTENDAVGEDLYEAGLFVNTGWATGDLTEGGTLLARSVYTRIAKTTAIWVTFTWEIPVSRGTE